MLPARRSLAACLAVAGLVAVGLTGCSASAGTPGCGGIATDGAAVQSVSATGSFAAVPRVTFSSPLHVSSTEARTIIAGSGAALQKGQEVLTDVTLLNGTTGAVVAQSGYGSITKTAGFVVGGTTVPGLQKALACTQVGQRIAVVIPPSQGLAAAQRGTTVSASDSLVAVVDVRRAFLARANGANQVMAGGLPAVVLAPSGQPGITLPLQSAPTSLQVANLKDGSGAQLKAGDTAVVQYTGWLWNSDGTATVFNSTWTDNGATALPVSRSTSAGMNEALFRGLSGQRVGSQVLIVAPPKDAYGAAGDTSLAVPANATLVYVVDVLGKA